jgi:hypothetical protein
MLASLPANAFFGSAASPKLEPRSTTMQFLPLTTVAQLERV